MAETLQKGTYKRQLQNGYEKPSADPMAFACLPDTLEDDLGGAIGTQGLRWRVLLLAHALGRAKAQVGEARTVEYYSRDATCEVAEEEFVYTMVSAAEDFYARLTGAERSEMYDDDGNRTDDFGRWYERFRYHFRKLRDEGYLERRRECVPEAKGTLGTVWACPCLTIDQIQSLPSCHELKIRPSDLDDQEIVEFCTQAGYVDVACAFEILVPRRHPKEFSKAETCSSVRDRGTYSDAVAWAQAFARDGSCPHAGDSGDRHMSIGAFRDVDIGKMGPSASTPCTTPWIVLEAEGGEGMAPIVDRFEATRDILEALDVEGADLSKVVVSYSGNKSFHIRIPGGMVGCPVFESSDTAETVLRRFADRITDHELDANLFDPRHLIRCIGSVHEETGRHVSAVHGDTFQRLSLEEMIASSEGHVPFALEDPFDVEVGPLRDHMHAACETLTRFWIPGFDEVEVGGGSGNVVQRAMQGIEEGEHWHERHHGRNKATFIAACHLIEKHGEERAWTKLQDVNDRHSPPLPRSEVETCFDSAKRTVK